MKKWYFIFIYYLLFIMNYCMIDYLDYLFIYAGFDKEDN